MSNSIKPWGVTDNIKHNPWIGFSNIYIVWLSRFVVNGTKVLNKLLQMKNKPELREASDSGVICKAKWGYPKEALSLQC
jgi:hypothetical protein